MYAKAKAKPNPRRDREHYAWLDRFDLLILAATFGIALPESILKAESVKWCEFPTGMRDGATRGWMKWARLHAFRPQGYERWYRPDLFAWVADPLEGFRRPPAHVTAPEHHSHVRAA